MPFDISIQQKVDHYDAPTTKTEQSVGNLLGQEAVTVENPESLLADAAEELTFAVDGTDDCSVEERAEAEDKQKALAEERRKKLHMLFEDCGRSKETQALKDAVTASDNKRDALRQVRQFFPDPLEAWIALDWLLNSFEENEGPDSENAAAVRLAKQHLEAEEGPAVRAGLCGLDNANGFDNLGDPFALGAFYRKTVLDFTDVSALYSHILDEYGGKFEVATHFLETTLASDLASAKPSMEKSHLEYVNTMLGEVRTLKSAHVLCTRMLDRWTSVHGVKDCQLTDMTLLGSIVSLREQSFINPEQFAQMSEKANSPDIEHKVLFLQELLSTARAFSPVLFGGFEGRMKLVDAIQVAVDSAVAEEDAWLAQQQ